jgi:nucleoside-diphosphate-sugar epimerase
MPKKIIVTGGAGFLGQNIVPILINAGYDVIALDKNKKNLGLLKSLNPKVHISYADLSQKGAWMTVFDGAYALVSAQAQIASPKKQDFIDNNIMTTRNIAQAAKRSNLKYIVHISSAAVNSIRKDHYATTKEASEKEIKQAKIPFTILRPSMMYGLFDNKNVGWLIHFAKKSPVFPIPGSGKYPRQPVYVEDMANLIVALLKKQPKNKTYNINGDTIHFKDMVHAILKSAKLKRTVLHLPVPVFIAAMQTVNLLRGKVEFTPDQVKSLTSGDVFEMYPWWKELKVPKTTFEQGMNKIMQSPHKDTMVSR